MKIRSIELAGTSKTTLRDGTPSLPRAFARISRQPGDGYITVNLLTSSGEREHRVDASDADDQFSMAEILQHALDGYEGSNSEVHDYYRELQRFAD